MTNQIQDAYIVAAVRTPVGKAPRGVFRNTRPDDMLAFAINAALSKCPSVDKARIDDAVIGCAMPEAEQGMNVARIAVLLAGLPNVVVGGDGQPLLFVRPAGRGDGGRPHPSRRGRPDDRRRHREHEHGADDGLSPGVQSAHLRERTHRHRLRHGHHGRKSRRAMEGHARGTGCIRRRQPRQGAGRDRRRRIRRRDRAIHAGRSLSGLEQARHRRRRARHQERRRPARRHDARRAGQTQDRVPRRRQRDRRQFLADVRRRRRRAARQRDRRSRTTA